MQQVLDSVPVSDGLGHVLDMDGKEELCAAGESNPDLIRGRDES